MTSAEPRNSDDYCYRHPDRQSFVLCQRCLRTICPECQTQAPVGVICPECLREQQGAQSPAQRKAERRWSTARPVAAPLDTRPLVTYAIIGITLIAYIVTLIPGLNAEGWLAFNSAFVLPASGVPFQPWRLFTVLLVHDGFWHVGLNMLALWMIGRSLEPLVGRWRFLALYLISGLGGSVAVALLAPFTWVVGASGAVFGLFGALLVIGRHIGANMRGIAIIIGINLALPFVFALIGAIGSGSFAMALSAIRISWQAHLGGLVAGALVGFIYARTRRLRQRPLQIGLLVGLTVVLLALLVIPAVFYL
ncbi:rhomboid family intramembrane serine protease [Microbacterium sp.]|uniref:rhomboid family intramembrane serine protease n=1 Tax=Microbacterium sp. TaxID=51671 RepID=UPI002D0023C1|nr:rhomboid family intramembrane serine protease [Microbacterium sp.]HWL76049.1 rhomboid family intramembrane serine protease [Microbacterium sp.]